MRLGPDHPEALAWLAAHWGMTQTLRHVTTDKAPRQSGPALAVRFWSADWTPWAALSRVRAHWPGLQFEVTPHYELA